MFTAIAWVLIVKVCPLHPHPGGAITCHRFPVYSSGVQFPGAVRGLLDCLDAKRDYNRMRLVHEKAVCRLAATP